jgi:hypothetical protein
MSLPPPDVTGLLRAWRAGDDGALERPVPLVDKELRQLAHAPLRAQEPKLQNTVLVHEAHLRLVNARQASWQNRFHFHALINGRDDLLNPLKTSQLPLLRLLGPSEADKHRVPPCGAPAPRATR